MQPKPKSMRNIRRTWVKIVTPKDVALYIISRLTTLEQRVIVEYAGDVFTAMVWKDVDRL